MNRREFIHNLALLAAGAAAMPAQVKAFELLYTATADVYAPITDGLIAVDEVLISGLADHSMPASIEIAMPGRAPLNWGINLFGGILRWTAMPDGKFITTPQGFSWSLNAKTLVSDSDFTGHVSFIDNNLVRRYVDLHAGELSQ